MILFNARGRPIVYALDVKFDNSATALSSEDVQNALVEIYGLIGSGGLATLGDVPDVNLTALMDGDVLTWDAGTSTWINAAPTTGTGTVDTIVEGPGIDVDATDPANPEVSVEAAVLAAVVSALQPSDKRLVPANYTADHTLALTDAYKGVEMELTATANNLTVPANATVAFDVGTVIPVTQIGTGQTTIVAAVGVTLLVNSSLTLKVRGQYCTVSLWKRATNTWVLSGDLEPV